MDNPFSGRHLLVATAALTSLLTLACLVLGLTAGHGILRAIGLMELAAKLDSIPSASAVVGVVGALVVLAIGVGLCLKGLREGSMKSTVEGTISSTTFREIPTGDDTEYGLFSRVSYCIDGVVYHNEGQHHDPSPTEAEARQRLLGIHRGEPVTVYFRPGDPHTIELDAPPSGTLRPLLAGIWLILSGLGTMFLNGIVFTG